MQYQEYRNWLEARGGSSNAVSTCSADVKRIEKVLAELWHQADANGEVGDDIPHLRPPTLAEMFAVEHDCHANETARLEVVS